MISEVEREILRQFELRKARNLRNYLFKQQQEAFDDTSTFVSCLCTRRAGKSFFAAVKAIEAAKKHPYSIVPYIALTRQSVKNIVWPVFNYLKNKYHQDITLLDGSLTAELKNGSRVILVGADQKNFIERLRGPKYPLAIIDEAQSFRSHVEQLVDDVLTPAIADYNGQIYLLGTPGPVCRGMFYDSTEKNLGWKTYKWTLYQNPHMPNADEFVKGIKKRKGWTDQNPTYLREWCGVWVEDLDALVYKFKRDKNQYTSLPQNNTWHKILGIDYGWNDKTAFGIVSYNPNSPKTFVEHCEGHSEMTPGEIAGRIVQLVEKYKPIKIVADTGGLGKSITEEMVRRYQIPIHAAKKTDKLTHISLLNGDFIDGNCLVHDSLTDLQDQYMSLSKDERGLEDPSLPNDLTDCVLYSWREARAYAFERLEEKTISKREKWDREAKKILQKEEEQLLQEENQDWWER